MKNVPNPFPMLGTNSDIDPVGYKKDLEKIRSVVKANIGNQPLIINIYGEYGQGKTTILKFLKEKFTGEWGNLSVFDNIDISKFPNLENTLVSCQERQEKEGTDGIFLILDEMQHVDPGTNSLSNEQKTFLNVLRRFADDTIENVNNQKFVLCIAMHPGTKRFLKEYGHIDVEQRINTLNVDLHDIDYYMAYKLIEEHFKKIGKDFHQYFDESFINAIYILLPHIENLRTGMSGRFNGRTFSQIFFNLFEYLRGLDRKLEFEDLKNILLDKYEVKLGSYKVLLANPDKYYEIELNLEDSEKYIFDRFLFNPKWHFKKEFEKIDEFFINKLIDRQLVSKRSCVSFDQKDFDLLDNELRNALNSLPYDRIYLNGEKKIFFIDTADEEITDKLLNITKIYGVYRLNDEHLKSIYNYNPKGGDSDKIISYYQKDPSKKVNYFYSLIKNSPIAFEKQNITSCQLGIQYPYMDVIYKLMDDIKHKIAIFYYAKDYASVDFDKYFNDILKELEKTDFDFALLFVCPYYMGDLPNDRVILRKMENRIFINDLTREDLLDFIKGNYIVIDDIIKECSKLFTQESVEKGFTMPLTGFMEKIKNKPSLFKEKFLDDIKKSWEIETSRKRDEDTQELAKILNVGVDGGGNLIELAKESLSEFINLEYGSIKGAKFSKYEKNILELFGSEKISKNEFEISKKKYFSYYSRFDIEDYVMDILENKSLIEIEKESSNKRSYKLIEPKDIITQILSTIYEGDIHELIKKDQDFYIKRDIGDLKLLLTDTNFNNLDYYKTALYNTELKRIQKSLEKNNDPDLDIIKKIATLYNSIQEISNYQINGIKISDINIESYFKNMRSESKSNIYNNANLKYLNLNDINEYLSQIIHSENVEIDKEILFSLNDILKLMQDWNLDNESNMQIKELLNKIKNINSENKTIEQINMENLIKNQTSDITQSTLELIYNSLYELDLYIAQPLFSIYNNITPKLEELDRVHENFNDYQSLFYELNDFYRKDFYLDKIRTVNFNNFDIGLENEFINNILCNSPLIVSSYIDFILDNSQMGEINDIIEIENEITENEKMNIKEYLNYVKNLGEIDYLTHYLTNSLHENETSENDFLRIISEVKNSEQNLSQKDDLEIVNEFLLPHGLIKRITLTEEYFKDGERIKKYDTQYQLTGD